MESAATRLQALCRGVAVRAVVVTSVRSEFQQLCDRLNAGAPAALIARPLWTSDLLCAPRFAAPIPRSTPTPPKPRSSPGTPRSPTSSSSSMADVQRELDWAKAALRSRIEYLERDPFQIGR